MPVAHASAPGGPVAAGADAPFDPDLGWTINPRVAVRPEPFGALLYHFGTRKLSFLKNLVVVDVVQCLHLQPSASAALDAAGVAVDDRAPYLDALDALARSGMIVPAADQE